MLRRMLPTLLVALCTPAFATEPQVMEVKLDSYTIKPGTITVKAGQPVTLRVKNEATFIPHNLVIKSFRITSSSSRPMPALM